MWGVWILTERAAGREAPDLPPPSLRWVTDCEEIARQESDAPPPEGPEYEE